MALYSFCPAHFSILQFAFLVLALGLCCPPFLAQQPKVLAPHKPIAPKVAQPFPSGPAHCTTPAVVAPQEARSRNRGSYKW